jgi:uncharacterized repeat protein (TIGR01451 family)
MASEAGLPIDPRFIEDAWVTVKQEPVDTEADLEIIKVADEEEVTIGEEVTYTITVENLGPVDATGVMVTDMLPSGVSYVSSNPYQGWYDVTSGVWNIGDLDNGHVATLEIVCSVNVAGEITNVAMISNADQPDPDTGDNSDAALIEGMTADAVECMTLVDGWNLVSLPLIPFNFDLEDVLLDVLGDVDTVSYYPGGPGELWIEYFGNILLDDLTTLEDGKGYFVEMDGTGTACFAGEEISLSPPNVPPSYPVVDGWNLIGFKSTTPEMPQDYLAAIAGKYTVIYGFDGAYFIVGSPGHEYFLPGLGYWIAMVDTGIIYP